MLASESELHNGMHTREYINAHCKFIFYEANSVIII